MIARLRATLALGFAVVMLAACANGDFGRVRPSLVSDSIHDWLGKDVTASVGLPVSVYPYTEDERLLRDLAFPLIQPAYRRNRWFSILEEYGLTRFVRDEWCVFDVSAYQRVLAATPFRSATARYARVNQDVRNDVVRILPFAAVARRVVDMDVKREKSLQHVTALTPIEAANAGARIAENALVIAWVQHALVNRAASYAFALERLVIALPSPVAVEVEQSLTLLKTRIAEGRVLPGPDIVPGAIVLVPPYPIAGLPPVPIAVAAAPVVSVPGAVVPLIPVVLNETVP